MFRLPLPGQCIGLDALNRWDRRARFSVGVGCPSFGGQRTDRGGPIRLLACLVTSLKPLLPAKRASRLALKQPDSCKLQRLSTLWSFRLVKAVSLSQPMVETAMLGRPNLKYQMPDISTRQRRASRRSSGSFSAVAVVRSCRLLAQPGPPNRSVKGTSRKRAAPYVGR
jgi:hypothetical protein